MLAWGFHSDDPRRIAHEMRTFVNNLQKRRGWSEIKISVADVDNFFPNMDRGLILAAVTAAIEELRKKNAKWFWF